MLKTKKPFLLLTLGAAIVVIGGSVVASWLVAQRSLFVGDAPVGTQLVPQDALITASITTDSQQWQQLRQFGTPETRAALDKQLTQMRESLLTANGYNYDQDIKPWLGKTAMIAYLASRTSSAGAAKGQVPSPGIPFVKQPDLIVLPIENPGQARQLLAKAKSQKVTQFVERTYRGVQIRETQKSKAQNYSIAVLDSFVIVANNPKITEQVIDTYKGAASVATTPGYLEALSKIDAPNAFAQLYLNIPVFSGAAAANSTKSLSPEKLAAEQQKQGIATTVTLEPEGLRFQGISWLKPNSAQTYKIENTSSRLPRRLPADTLVMMSGGDLVQLWQGYAQGSESNPFLPIPPANLNATLQAMLGLDLEEDLLPWMAGEFSVALISAPSSVIALPNNQQPTQLGAGVVFMVQASDRSRAQATLQKLDQFMASRYRFSIEQTQIGGQPVVNWTSPLGGVSASHGWLDGNVVFLTLGAPITSTMVPQPPTTLPQTPLFQQVVPTRPNPNNGQFFLDVERTINKGTLNLPQLLSPEQKMVANAIRAIGFTGAISDKRSNRFNLFVQMKTTVTPTTTPTPSPSTTTPTPVAPTAIPTPSASTPTPSSPSPASPPASATPTTTPTSSAPTTTPTPPNPATPPSNPSASPTPQLSPSPSPSR
ncbi:MAG TPA: DUF3352 domain-containing protein [Coleofasciculaceae cyanobacterium]